MKKVNVQDVFMGKQQRRMCCVGIYRGDEYAYMGTYSGDLMKVALNCCDIVNVTQVGQTSGLVGAYGVHNPRKPFGKDCNRYVHGVRVLRIVDDGLLLVGAGDGVVELVEERKDINENVFKNYPNPTCPMLKMVRTMVQCLLKAIALSVYSTAYPSALILRFSNFKFIFQISAKTN